MKLFVIILTILFTACTTSKKATLVGYDKDRMILVSNDTISYGSHSKGKVGDRYTVKFRGNKVVRIKKSNQ